MELKDLRSYKRLQQIDNKLASQVETVYNATKETINSISGCYNNYTMHDIGHCMRVAVYMEEIAFGIEDDFDKNIQLFSALELALLILSALLHDIGMFIRPEDREQIKNNNIKYTTSLTFNGVMKTVNDEGEAIKEIVRITHAQRIKEFINYSFGGNTITNILMLDDKYPYADDVVAICVAHGENYDYLKNLRPNLKGNYQYNVQFLAAILRIADYLDLDKQRTPVLWYKIMNIDGFSREEWEKHFMIHNERKLKKYIDNKMQVFFEGKSHSPKIHRRYLSYIDGLKIELENADELLNTKTSEARYSFRLATKVEDNVSTEGFKYSDLRLNLNYSSITELLMGKNIYGDSRLGLRELVQNSIDACEIMKEASKKGNDLIVAPQIYITFSKTNNYVKIKDTGIGMTLEVVKKHFLNIGKSYYKSNEYIYENYKYKPIGQYGIGFLACFLLSDNVIVKTKYYKTNEINQIELEKNSEYVVTNTEETGTFIGTEISLDFNKFFDVFQDKAGLITFLEKYFMTSIPIRVRDDDNEEEYIDISNSCNVFVENKITKDQASKHDTIVCQEYSQVLNGTIHISEIRKKKNFKIEDIMDNLDLYYIFDKEKNIFLKLNNTDQLTTGYYYILTYTNIKDEDYEKIVKSRKQNKNKRAEIFCLGKKVYFLIKKDNKTGYMEMDDSNLQITINNIFIKDIIENSGYRFYEELLDDEYFENIFVYDNKYINLQHCNFDGSFYFSEEDIDKLDFFFFNRGVWIRDFRFLVCLIPYSLKTFGVVNYFGDEIKLDVSRNSVIAGSSELKNELANIILKYMKKKTSDIDWLNMLDQLIQYNFENKSNTDNNMFIS